MIEGHLKYAAHCRDSTGSIDVQDVEPILYKPKQCIDRIIEISMGLVIYSKKNPKSK